jgi:hypothetical protein
MGSDDPFSSSVKNGTGSGIEQPRESDHALLQRLVDRFVQRHQSNVMDGLIQACVAAADRLPKLSAKDPSHCVEPTFNYQGSNLYWELEGEEVAEWLARHGITGVILKYRVRRRPDDVMGEPARRPLQDAQRALRLVCSRAAEWKIDPDRIGMIGFSAGGHLAIATATRFDCTG